MWRKQEEPKPPSQTSEPVAPPSLAELRRQEAPTESPTGGQVSQGLSIRGEVRGREDLFIDGTVQGTIQINEGNVTIGPKGHVAADIEARQILVLGRVEGALRGVECVQIGRTGQVMGDVATRRIAIEEGAFFRGKIDVAEPEERLPSHPVGREAAVEGLRPVVVSAKEEQS